MPRKIEISHRTIIFTVFLLILVWFLYFIRDILIELFVALLLMTILNPYVVKLTRLRIPKALSILFLYFVIIGLVGIAIGGVVAPLIEQSTNFVNGLPRYLESLGASSLIGEKVIGELLSEIGRLPSQVAKVALSILSNIIGVFTVLIFTFYLLLSRDKLDSQLAVFFGPEKQKEISRIVDLLEKNLGGWVRGQLFLMFLIGLATYIGLSILGIPFALPLSMLAGLLEIVPYVGPVIAAIPAIIIGLGISPLTGLATMALSFLIQQLENYLFVPKIMEKSTGIAPIVTLLALAIGFRIAGVAGVIVSVPMVIILQVLSKEYILSRR